MEKLLTPEQVADRLCVAKRTAYTMLAPGGALHHLRLDVGPKTIRVFADELEQYIEEARACS